MIVAVAIYGAALGFWMRPGVRAVIFAALSVAALQFSAIWLSQLFFNEPTATRFVWMVRAWTGDKVVDLVPTAAMAAFAASLAAFVSALTRSGEQRRRLRRVHAIED